ncbi:hypothetical protein [Cetobacterium sp.]
MKKINSKIANKLGEKFRETNNNKAIETIEIKEKYNPILNYDDFELEIDQKEKMIVFEEKAVFHAQELSKNTIELSKVFSAAQKTLAACKTGTFVKWYEALGFKKDFVYMLLKRNDLFLELSNEKVFQIPEKAIKTISKIKDKVDTKVILDIVNAEKPVEVAKEKESYFSGNPKDRKNEIEDIEMLEGNFDKIKELEKKLSEYYRKIKEIEYELSILKKESKEK